MFKGYYKKPKETSDAFDGEWFRTGDLFRKDENGYYYIVGRKKDMIRRSGENISSSEVENILTSHPKIISAAVVPVKDINRGEEVKAYIVPIQGETTETLPPEEIVSYCLDRIAEFKVPRYIEYKNSVGYKNSFALTPCHFVNVSIFLSPIHAASIVDVKTFLIQGVEIGISLASIF